MYIKIVKGVLHNVVQKITSGILRTLLSLFKNKNNKTKTNWKLLAFDFMEDSGINSTSIWHAAWIFINIISSHFRMSPAKYVFVRDL
jgi:hypothetical protein